MTDLTTALRQWRGAHPARVASQALGVSLRTYQGWEAGREPGDALRAVLMRAIQVPLNTMLEAKND